MSDNEKIYEAVTVAGGGSGPMTLEDARHQAEAWNDKGYTAYVVNLEDDAWEDVEIVAPITPEQVVDSYGADREELEQFAYKLIELLGWEYAPREDGFMVYTYEGEYVRG